MPIKRLTIELDDSADQTSPTSAPESLVTVKSRAKRDNTPSSMPTHYEDENDEKGTYKTNKTGRTFPDLITESMDNPKVMFVILMFAPFIIFASKIDSIMSFKYPILTGLILNFFWFIVPWVVKSTSRLLDRK